MKLENLRRKRDYYVHEAPAWIRVVFSSYQGFDWFVKDQKSTLVERGAIIKAGRDWLVDMETFPAVTADLKGLPSAAREVNG